MIFLRRGGSGATFGYPRWAAEKKKEKRKNLLASSMVQREIRGGPKLSPSDRIAVCFPVEVRTVR